MKSIGIVIPAYNEKENILKLIKAIRRKIYSIFLDIKKIMQFMIIELYLYCWFTNYNDK